MDTPRLLRAGFRLLAVALSAAVDLPAQESPASYRLYVGVDLMLRNETEADDYRRVDALKPRQIILDEPGRPMVPLRQTTAFSWERIPRVSRVPITIADFEHHRAYTVQNDAAMANMRTQNDMVLYQQEKVDAARAKAGFSDLMRMSATAVVAENDRAEREGIAVTAMTREAAQANLDNWSAQAEADFNTMTDQMDQSASIISDPTFIDRMQAGVNGGTAEVLELSFRVSSPVPIADAYVVVMGAIKQPDETAGVVVFPQPIGAIGPEPRLIKIRQTGFEPGFTITDVKLHLYSHGKELGTNLSEKAVQLTRDQAREYLLLTHVATHQFDTLGPVPVWELVPPAVLANKDPKAFDYPVVVNIDADGSVISIHDDEQAAREFLNEIQEASALRQRATPQKAAASLGESVRVADDSVALDQTGRLPTRIVAAIQDMVFLPGIDLGQPQVGTTRVNLAEFYR